MTFTRALRPPGNKPQGVANITSLVDITLVLVLYMAFLFATQSSILAENRPNALPTAAGGHMDTSGLHMVLTMDAIRVENVQVMTLDDGALPEDSAPALENVRRALEQSLAHQLFLTTSEESLINRAASSGWLYLDAVHNIPYTTIEAITHTARAAGLEHFRFVVHAKR